MNKIFTVLSVFIFGFANHSNAITLEKTQVLTYDGQKLNAIWTLPTEKTVAAILILQGSGNVDLDGEVSSPLLGSGYQGKSAKLSEQMALQLASAGIASLRFSKRGFDDHAQLPFQTIPYLVKDAVSALEMIQTRFHALKFGALGISEGALIATLASGLIKFDSLFLLSIPTRGIDDVLGYQFFSWPTELLMKKFDLQHAGFMNHSLMLASGLKNLPLIGAPVQAADLNHDGQISVVNELWPTYQGFYQGMRGLLETEAFSAWYQSLKNLPPFSSSASKVKTNSIYIYQGLEDAQVRWNWILEDSFAFPVKPNIHFFPNVGHCFSPMEGTLGEMKTSGPYSNDLLIQVTQDVIQGLKN